jgi:hypothetical protein
MLVKWSLPLNVDGSTILDGWHYEIQYGVSPVLPAEWQTAVAPWGDLQAMINDLTPGIDYDFRIRAMDSSGNQGEWSTVQTEQANPDTIPPSTPAPPTVAGNLLSIQITHTLGKASGGEWNLEADLDHFEVHVGDSTSYTADETTLKGKVAANGGMIVAEIPAVGTVPCEETTTRYVRVVAVDVAGNRSDPSTTATVTAELVDSAHISDLVVSKVTAGTISANWLLGASIRTASSGQRVELNATGLHGFNGAGTELVTLSNTGSFTLRTASSGARIQIDGDGFAAYNSGGSQTVDIDAASGTVTVVGQVATGFSGRRVVMDPTNNEVRFYPASGSAYARVVEYSSHPGVGAINLETGQLTSPIRYSALILTPEDVNLVLGNVASSGGFVSRIIMTPSEFALQTRLGGSDHYLEYTAGSGWRVDGSSLKSFIIDHPTDPDRYLVHACTESPQAGVEYWGDTVLDDQGRAVVTLPDYFEALTLPTGRAVSVNTCSDEIKNASATYPENGQFTIHGAPDVRVTWIVKAIRDAGGMLVEPQRDQIDVHGDGPYRYYTLKEPHAAA